MVLQQLAAVMIFHGSQTAKCEQLKIQFWYYPHGMTRKTQIPKSYLSHQPSFPLGSKESCKQKE